jgi:uncharacterized SAM-binding protein YcdF (DUF218 family)
VILRALATFAVAYLAVAALLFVVHHGDTPAKADAIVVLSGTDSRLSVGERLAAGGYGRPLVISRSNDPSPAEVHACANGALCFRADPYSTRGEARAIARLATKHHWRMVDVVTSQYHVFRARILIRRCYHGGLRMIGAPQSTLHLPIDVVRETLKLTYQEVFARDC